MDINPVLKTRDITDYRPSCSTEKRPRPVLKNQPIPYDNHNGCVPQNYNGKGPAPYNMECRTAPKGLLTDSGRS